MTAASGSRLTRVSGWGRTSFADSYVAPIQDEASLRSTLLDARARGLKVSSRGGGKSFGDMITNAGGVLLDLQGLRTIGEPHWETGEVVAEAGVRLAELLDLFLPRGWTVPAVPGSPYVTVGGAIANNVHGKDSFAVGNFGGCVRELTVMFHDGRVEKLSREHGAELFRAFVGGMGHLGVILSARLQLKKVRGPFVSVRRRSFEDLAELESIFRDEAPASDMAFGWVDAFSERGRGFLEIGNWSSASGVSRAPRPIANRPSRLFGCVPYSFAYPFLRPFLARPVMATYNALKFSLGRRARESVGCDAGGYCFPLAYAVPEHNELFPGRGVFEAQLAVPEKDAFRFAREVLALGRSLGLESWLCAIKRLRPDDFLVSFNTDGYSISVEVPARARGQKGFAEGFRRLIDLTRQMGGQVNLSKEDQLLTSEDVRAMYAGAAQLVTLKHRIDPNSLFESDQYRRLFAPLQ